jgi:nucleoside-diphosphate-sugar epimerase
MTRVLLTGASGFLGRHALPALLSRGLEVHAVSSRPAPAVASRVAWHRADLLDLEQARRLVAGVRPTHLLHLAWITEPGAYRTSPENFRWVQASLALLQAFADQGGRRAVMAGSCAEYDARHGLCSEDRTPTSPATTYGVCKHALGLLGEAFARQADLGWAWGRIFFLYGPHERPERLVPSVILALLRGEPAVIRHAGHTRDFLHVADAADAFAALLDGPVTGAINIASGSGVGLGDLAKRIATRLRRTDLLRLETAPEAPSDPPAQVGEVRRLSEEVGWTPRYDLERGLDETIAWWREHA